jgi:pimeloyl-ACP methyl ester carboxylesterase
MEISETTYVEAEGGHLAYQIVGDGPDLLFTTSPIHNIDVMWEQPSIARFFGRLAAFGRLICYNPRGSGVASPLPPGSSLQEWMDDARRVLDALEIERAAFIGDTEGGPTAMLFAATHPDRVSALVLVNTFARFLRDEDYPWGMPPEAARRLGFDIRAGLHTGECEVIGDDMGGIAVHIGARVAGLARPSEVLVSRTVSDLVAGSGIVFDDRGPHELKGVPGDWRLYAVKA